MPMNKVEWWTLKKGIKEYLNDITSKKFKDDREFKEKVNISIKEVSIAREELKRLSKFEEAFNEAIQTSKIKAQAIKEDFGKTIKENVQAAEAKAQAEKIGFDKALDNSSKSAFDKFESKVNTIARKSIEKLSDYNKKADKIIDRFEAKLKTSSEEIGLLKKDINQIKKVNKEAISSLDRSTIKLGEKVKGLFSDLNQCSDKINDLINISITRIRNILIYIREQLKEDTENISRKLEIRALHCFDNAKKKFNGIVLKKQAEFKQIKEEDVDNLELLDSLLDYIRLSKGSGLNYREIQIRLRSMTIKPEYKRSIIELADNLRLEGSVNSKELMKAIIDVRNNVELGEKTKEVIEEPQDEPEEEEPQEPEGEEEPQGEPDKEEQENGEAEETEEGPQSNGEKPKTRKEKILDLIEEEDKKGVYLKQKDIAEKTGYNKSNVNVLVTQLEKEKEVKKDSKKFIKLCRK